MSEHLYRVLSNHNDSVTLFFNREVALVIIGNLVKQLQEGRTTYDIAVPAVQQHVQLDADGLTLNESVLRFLAKIEKAPIWVTADSLQYRVAELIEIKYPNHIWVDRKDYLGIKVQIEAYGTRALKRWRERENGGAA